MAQKSGPLTTSVTPLHNRYIVGYVNGILLVHCSACTAVHNGPALSVFRASESSCLHVGYEGRKGPTDYTYRILISLDFALGQ